MENKENIEKEEQDTVNNRKTKYMVFKRKKAIRHI